MARHLPFPWRVWKWQSRTRGADSAEFCLSTLLACSFCNTAHVVSGTPQRCAYLSVMETELRALHARGKHSAAEPDLGPFAMFSAASLTVLSRASLPYLLSMSSSFHQPPVCTLALWVCLLWTFLSNWNEMLCSMWAFHIQHVMYNV